VPDIRPIQRERENGSLDGEEVDMNTNHNQDMTSREIWSESGSRTKNEEDISPVEISVGTIGDTAGGDEEPKPEVTATLNEAEEYHEEDVAASSSQICQVCNVGSNKASNNEAQEKEEQKLEDTTPSNICRNLGGDYFGIDCDVRDRGTMCDICLLHYEAGDEVAWSPNLECSHTYHKDCILDW
jgi:hypothetical protein